MKTAAIVLWVIQAIALMGCFVDPNGLYDNFFQWLGFFTPTIIGIILWVKASKKAKKTEEQE